MSDPMMLSIEELARHFDVTKNAVYKWIRTGKIPAHCVVRIGRRMFVKREELEQWLSAA